MYHCRMTNLAQTVRVFWARATHDLAVAIIVVQSYVLVWERDIAVTLVDCVAPAAGINSEGECLMY